MIRGSGACDPPMVPAVERRGQADVRATGRLPEGRLFAPVIRCAGAARCPYFDPDRLGIASSLASQRPQRLEYLERTLVGRIRVRHPAITPFGDARQCQVVMPAIPHRNTTR